MLIYLTELLHALSSFYTGLRVSLDCSRGLIVGKYFGDPTRSDLDPFEGPVWKKTALVWTTPLQTPVAAWNGGSFLTGSIANANPYNTLVEEAFKLWGAVTGLTFSRPTQQSPRDVLVGFDSTLLAQSGGDGVGVTQGVGKAPNSAMKSPVVVEIQDPRQLTAVPMPDGDVLYQVPATANIRHPQLTTFFNTVVHEIGHALGLDHNPTDPFSVMYDPDPNDPARKGLANLSIDANDLAAIQKLYPKAAIEKPKFYLEPASRGQVTSTGIVIPGTYGAAQAGLDPFGFLDFSDIIGLGLDIQISFAGPGVLNDPTPNSFATFRNGVFDEKFINLETSYIQFQDPVSKLNRTDYANAVFDRIQFQPDQLHPQTTTFHVKVTDSLGRVRNTDYTINTAPATSNPPKVKPLTPPQNTMPNPYNSSASPASMSPTPVSPASAGAARAPTPDPAKEASHAKIDLTNISTISEDRIKGPVTTPTEPPRRETPLMVGVQSLEHAVKSPEFDYGLALGASKAGSFSYPSDAALPASSASLFAINDQPQALPVGVSLSGTNAGWL